LIPEFGGGQSGSAGQRQPPGEAFRIDPACGKHIGKTRQQTGRERRLELDSLLTDLYSNIPFSPGGVYV